MFDIAAATQKVYEEMLNEILMLASSIVDSQNLVLMGGCALNCSANNILYNYFDKVWIMPAPGDNGSSIGAVLANKKKHVEWNGPYLGHNIQYCNSNEIIVNYLLKEKICGLARGRAEFGPRSLGNRSLLADPRDPKIKDLVNNVKHREQFRPFAPAILEEFADQYFEMPTKITSYMQYTAKCLFPDRFPGIVHVDGTSRVQTVSKKDNLQFRDLLEKWFLSTGCPMLLNTSLNIKGSTVVNDISDAKNFEILSKIKVFN
jgi:carbamoyltransferase